MLSVRFINDEDDGELKSGFESSEQAEQYIQDLFCNGGVDDGDTLVLLQNGVEYATYTIADFDC